MSLWTDSELQEVRSHPDETYHVLRNGHSLRYGVCFPDGGQSEDDDDCTEGLPEGGGTSSKVVDVIVGPFSPKRNWFQGDV